MDWAVVLTHPNSEKKAVANSEAQGFECFHPTMRTKKIIRGRRAFVQESMFPGYFFARIVDRWRAIRSTIGVRDLLTMNDRPGLVSDLEIQKLKKICDESGRFIPVEQRFARGQRLLIKDGPFRDFTGIYEGMRVQDRLEILLNIFGRDTRVIVEEGSLEAA